MTQRGTRGEDPQSGKELVPSGRPENSRLLEAQEEGRGVKSAEKTDRQTEHAAREWKEGGTHETVHSEELQDQRKKCEENTVYIMVKDSSPCNPLKILPHALHDLSYSPCHFLEQFCKSFLSV